MNRFRAALPGRARLALGLAVALALAAPAAAQTGDAEAKPRLDLYGFIMVDTGYDFGQVHPDWFDTLRPTKLPSYENEFGDDGNTYFSVRQTRFGVKGFLPTKLGELKTVFEFEMFGTGVDAGQTTIRLRHAYGELGKWGAGQTWSPFMDIDVFPNSLEYWGPNGMVFFRNVQIRYMPIQGDTRLTIALERPGASADQGDYAGRVELQDVKPHFKWPDLSAEYRSAHPWGYVELAGILRSIKWEDNGVDQYDLSGSATGWGLNLSTNVKVTKNDTIRGQLSYGEGIENYMNDAPVDVGIKPNPGNPTTPIKGVALPVFGLVAFLDHNWNGQFSTAVGYSRLDIDNSEGQAANAFKSGQYGLVNILYTPVQNALVGAELQWGRRQNFEDGWSVTDTRIQVSFKYNFGITIGGNK